jgi:hypothetical protein
MKPMPAALVACLFAAADTLAQAPAHPGPPGAPPVQPAPTPAPKATQELIAIDVLLEPGETLVGHTEDVQALLQKDYPAGHALAATQTPHITLLQRYVRAMDLQPIERAVAKVLTSEAVTGLSLQARSYDSVPTHGDLGLLVVNVAVSPELRRLQEKLVQAVQPFAVSGGTPDAFVRSSATAIDPRILNRVESFVTSSSGARYVPQAAIGFGHQKLLRKLKSQPFRPFSFKPEGAAIYQLGDDGTASKKLWSEPER